MTTENYFYLDATNQPVGPLELSALSELAKAGVINPESLVAKVGGSEWVAWKSIEETVVAVPTNKKADTTTQEAKPTLLPEAYAIYKKAKVETSEFDKTALVNFPKCSAGMGLFSNYSAFLRASYAKTNDGQLLKFVGTHGLYLTISQESTVHWSKANLSGGSSLQIDEITKTLAVGQWTSHLFVHLEKDVLTKHMNTGMKIRVSSPSQGEQEIIEISPAHIQAVLFFQDEDSFVYDPAAAKTAVAESSFMGQVDKFNAKFYMFLWAFFSWICAVNAFFAVFLIFSSPKDSLLVLLICSALAAPYFIFKHRRKKKEEAAQAAKNAPEGETTSAQA